jgi:hypothetical protein
MRFGGLIIDTVVCLTLAKWETVSGQFGGYFSLASYPRAYELDTKHNIEFDFTQPLTSIKVTCYGRKSACEAFGSTVDWCAEYVNEQFAQAFELVRHFLLPTLLDLIFEVDSRWTNAR